jgi:hypothetical protein
MSTNPTRMSTNPTRMSTRAQLGARMCDRRIDSLATHAAGVSLQQVRGTESGLPRGQFHGGFFFAENPDLQFPMPANSVPAVVSRALSFLGKRTRPWRTDRHTHVTARYFGMRQVKISRAQRTYLPELPLFEYSFALQLGHRALFGLHSKAPQAY